jgi:hypothetical protein
MLTTGSGRVLCFGGLSVGCPNPGAPPVPVLLDDMWEWVDAQSQWRQLELVTEALAGSSITDPISPRLNHAMAQVGDKVVLFGGMDFTTVYHDYYEVSLE